MDIASQHWLDKYICRLFAAVLAERGQHVVRGVPERGHQAAHHHWLPRARPLPRRRPLVQHGGVRRRLQVPRRLAHEPQQQVQSVVVPPPATRLSNAPMAPMHHMEDTLRLPDELPEPLTHDIMIILGKLIKFLYLT